MRVGGALSTRVAAESVRVINIGGINGGGGSRIARKATARGRTHIPEKLLGIAGVRMAGIGAHDSGGARYEVTMGGIFISGRTASGVGMGIQKLIAAT